MNYNLIVAMCQGSRGIGYKGKMPWNSKADLAHFYKLTKGTGENAVIMGSTTWKSLPNKMLPGRNNFIISSTLNEHSIMKDGHIIKTFDNINAVINFCNLMEYDEVWVIGGESLYKQFLDLHLVNKCYITTIDKHYECDTFFPELNSDEWVVNNKYTIFDIDNKLVVSEYHKK